MPETTTAVAAAPIVSYEEAVLPFAGEELACLYVVVDARSRPDVGAFLTAWHQCCELAEFDWQAVRRAQSALVGIELRHCCEDADAPPLRLVFDARRDRGALDRLAATEALVVGNRRWGAFANTVVAYGVDGNAVRAAVAAAQAGLRDLTMAG